MKIFIAMAIFLSIIFFALVSLSESDNLFNMWSNLRYLDGNFPQKIEFNYDGTYATYKYSSSMDVTSRGTYQITKKWSDSKGYIWYQIIISDLREGKRYQLARVDKKGRKLEFVYSIDSYPPKLNPDEIGYCIYWRTTLDYELSPE
jgi:hypothetical protein